MHKGRVVFGAMDEVVFGEPAAEAIVRQMDRLHTSRAFLMVSGTLRRETDEIDKIRHALGSRCVAVFDAMPQHTPREAVISAAEQARAAEADLIVTVGGGSITDGAKAVQLCLANNVRTVDGIDAIRAVRGVVPPIAARRAPDQRADHDRRRRVFGDRRRHQCGGQGEGDAAARARHAARGDPRSRALRAHAGMAVPSTGIRAVDHCVEGLCSREAHPYADAQALKGLSMLAAGLPRVKANPRDLDARMDCQIGTWLSTGPLTSGVPMGANHGIGYVLGAAYGVPHGYTSCVMLPFVMRWNRIANADRQALVSEAMGQPGRDASDVLDKFIRDLGMPRSLHEVNVGKQHFDAIAQAAMATPWVPRNPRKMAAPPRCAISWIWPHREHDVYRQARSSASAATCLHHGGYRRGSRNKPGMRSRRRTALGQTNGRPKPPG